ncbi:MAG: Hpt domain-containing protein [Rhodobacteraceae bacterium]|jgi:HPt (histidine-containing phosphotransfer) domain-containing protein|nr:Hpt domain-containing protein [Paracoccaceae bacterium]
MIDWDRVAQLRDEVGPHDFGEVVELFLEEVDEVTGRLPAAAAAGRLSDDLHFLKGSALNLGFRAFGIMCQEAERAAAAGGSPAIGPILECFAASRQAFVTELAARSAA